MRALSVVFAVGLLGGCAHKAVLEAPIRNLTARDFKADQNERRALLAEFSGRLKLSYETMDQGLSGKGRVVGRFPSGLRLELRDAIGRLHYVLVGRGKNFTAHYPRAKRAFRDASGGEPYFARQWGTPITFADLSGLYAGVLPERWHQAEPATWEWDRSRGAFRAEFQSKGERLEVWVSSEHAALEEVVWERSGARVTIRYSDFELQAPRKGARVALAHEVLVSVPASGARVGVVWDTLAPLTRPLPDSAFEFKAPPGHRVLEKK